MSADPSTSHSPADLPDRSLPPVEAPTGSFILQLFLIPLVIVSMVVLLWLMFSWMAHMGRDNPQAIVQQLSRFDESSWQRAYELAELLRSPDPKYDELRRDPKVCGELIRLLEKDLKLKVDEDDPKKKAATRGNPAQAADVPLPGNRLVPNSRRRPRAAAVHQGAGAQRGRRATERAGRDCHAGQECGAPETP